jgi:hypothetical protein
LPVAQVAYTDPADKIRRYIIGYNKPNNVFKNSCVKQTHYSNKWSNVLNIYFALIKKKNKKINGNIIATKFFSHTYSAATVQAAILVVVQT